MPSTPDYRGIIPAIACPFTSEYRIDEPALRKHASWPVSYTHLTLPTN